MASTEIKETNVYLLLRLHKIQLQIQELLKTSYGQCVLYTTLPEYFIRDKISNWPLFYIAMNCAFIHTNPEYVKLYVFWKANADSATVRYDEIKPMLKTWDTIFS